jgi:hypothetical protein
MYRVVTIRYLNHGTGRKRVVSRGPLHPDRNHAKRWADYLQQLGDYQIVRVEASNEAKTAVSLS